MRRREHLLSEPGKATVSEGRNGNERLQIVIASTRPGYIGKPIGEWVTAEARTHKQFEMEVAGLAEIKLPFFNEPNHPRLQKYEHWTGAPALPRPMPSGSCSWKITYGISAPLKNALDYLVAERNQKPAGRCWRHRT